MRREDCPGFIANDAGSTGIFFTVTSQKTPLHTCRRGRLPRQLSRANDDALGQVIVELACTLLCRVDVDFRGGLVQRFETDEDIVIKDIAGQVRLGLHAGSKPMQHLDVVITAQQFFRLSARNFGQCRVVHAHSLKYVCCYCHS